MQDESFTVGTATSAKARKAAKKQLSSSSKKSIATHKKSTKPSTFLSTQPTPLSFAPLSSTDDPMGEENLDSMLNEFERFPLDYGVKPTITKKQLMRDMLANPQLAKEAEQAMQLDDEQNGDDDDEIIIDPSQLPTPLTRLPPSEVAIMSAQLSFPAIAVHTTSSGLTQKRKISIPQHRMTPLKRDWLAIYEPLVRECGLMVRMNVGRRWVELKTSKHTPSASSLSRASDFLSAYALGFTSADSLALLRLEELYVESFEIKDVKTLLGDHLSRAIGRIAGHEGKTRFVVENASRTRIVLADTKIHILGTFSNIKIARDAICALILGSPPGKIYAGLRQVAARSRERF